MALLVVPVRYRVEYHIHHSLAVAHPNKPREFRLPPLAATPTKISRPFRFDVGSSGLSPPPIHSNPSSQWSLGGIQCCFMNVWSVSCRVASRVVQCAASTAANCSTSWKHQGWGPFDYDGDDDDGWRRASTTWQHSIFIIMYTQTPNTLVLYFMSNP